MLHGQHTGQKGVFMNNLSTDTESTNSIPKEANFKMHPAVIIGTFSLLAISLIGTTYLSGKYNLDAKLTISVKGFKYCSRPATYTTICPA